MDGWVGGREGGGLTGEGKKSDWPENNNNNNTKGENSVEFRCS